MRKNTVTKGKIADVEKMVNDLLDEQHAHYRGWLREKLRVYDTKNSEVSDKKTCNFNRFSEYLKT